jgi:glucosamine-6-phosphate deaminase
VIHDPVGGLRLVVLEDADAVADYASAHIAARLTAKPGLVLGLPTGETPRGIYARLVKAHRSGEVSFANAASFNLDEYLGLPPDHPASYHAYMREMLFRHVDIDPTRAHLPDGLATDATAEGLRYEQAIAEAGGIDLMVLGIGGNGHIGFNEPGSPFDSRTRPVRLTEATRAANAHSFPAGETVPASAITMGIATILDSREILLVATGPAKAAALAAALHGPESPQCPASVLRRHPAVTVVCDGAASVASGG